MPGQILIERQLEDTQLSTMGISHLFPCPVVKEPITAMISLLACTELSWSRTIWADGTTATFHA